MAEPVAAALLREVLDALSAQDLDRVAAVVDEQFEFVDVGGGEDVHGRGRQQVQREEAPTGREERAANWSTSCIAQSVPDPAPRAAPEQLAGRIHPHKEQKPPFKQVAVVRSASTAQRPQPD